MGRLNRYTVGWRITCERDTTTVEARTEEAARKKVTLEGDDAVEFLEKHFRNHGPPNFLAIEVDDVELQDDEGDEDEDDTDDADESDDEVENANDTEE